MKSDISLGTWANPHLNKIYQQIITGVPIQKWLLPVILMISESWLGFVHVSIRETKKLHTLQPKGLYQPKMLLRLAGFMKRE
jgi:hypothetical protein